jgi:3',5'-cyclic AMP phosphodiesterase CpdA
MLLEKLVASGVGVNALVFTGDLADRGEPGAYARLKALVEPFAASLGATVVWVMGNHDEREPFSQVLWGEAPSGEPQDRVFDCDGLRLIALDTSVPGFHHGELTPAQLEWLSTELSTPAPQGTIIALHHPPIPTPIELMGVIELDNQHALAEVVRGTDVRGILAGHLHYSTFSTFAGVPVSVCAASCYTIDLLGPKDTILRAVPGGLSASLVHVYPDQVVFSTVPLEEQGELAHHDAAGLAAIAAMSKEQRRAMFSDKNSEFNRASDREQSGF